MYVKSVYIRVRFLIDSLIRRYRWMEDAKSIRKTIQKKELQTIDNNAAVLILAPHSDDEWIGCSQIVKKYPNSVICNMNMQGGDDENIHNRRIEEMITLARAYNRTIVHRDITDIDSFSSIIQDIAPDYIFLPFILDWHDEHRVVMQFLNDIIKLGLYSREIACYQVSVPIDPNLINFAIPMTKDEQDEKWRIFKHTYVTQLFMPVERFEAHERINGALCAAYAAESFIVYNAIEWSRLYTSNQLEEKKIQVLKQNLNNIGSIRNIVSKIKLV